MENHMNERGSSLVLVITIMSILILLGTTLLTLALINFKMKDINSTVKQSYYIAEGALEEGYVKLNQLCINLLEESHDYANNNSNKYKSRFKEKFPIYVNDKLGASSSYEINDINLSVEINSIEINEINDELHFNVELKSTYSGKTTVKVKCIYIGKISKYDENINNMKIDILITDVETIN